MEGLSTVVDVVVVLIVIVSAYLAMVRGLVRELLALAGWVAAFFAALFLTPAVQPIVSSLTGPDGFLADCQIGMLSAFVLVFGVALILTGIVVWLFSGPSRNRAASIVDQGLGFIYGALRGLVLVAIVFILYDDLLRETGEFAFVEDAATIGVVSETASAIEGLFQETPALIRERMEAMLAACEARRDGQIPGAEGALWLPADEAATL